MDIIAEDLGTLTADVFKLLEQTKYPNMKVLEFGLTEWDNMYHPKIILKIQLPIQVHMIICQ